MPNIAAGIMKRSSPRKVLQELIAPDLKELKSELHEFRAEIYSEIKRLDEKIDLLGKRLDEKINSRHNELLSEIKRLDERIDSLDKKIEIGFALRERFAALEVKIAALTASR